MHRTTLILAALLAAAALPACQSNPAKDARVYAGFGGYERAVTTTSPEAQRWFDQGIQLVYGFNHDEAIRSFHAAAQADEACAMAWWGVAYANGLHINKPEMSRKASRRAWIGAQEALERIDNASPAEQALIRAVAARYDWPPPDDRAHLDQAYADAMQDAYESFPDDPDVATLYAESLMNLQPWDYWTPDGEPVGRIDEIVDALEHAIAVRPDHPGANHFYIHAVEASETPERAVASADRLVDLVPGSGHLVHMPSHIYVRVGRYAEASDANIRAIEADRAYFAVAPEPDFYSLYYAHNIHFLAYASMMEGRYEAAMRAARELETEIPEEFWRANANIVEGIMPTTYHVMIRFGRWDDILAEPRPADWRLFSIAVHHYARSVAYSATGRTIEARRELDLFEEAVADVPEDWWIFNNRVHQVLPIAFALARGELAFREGRYDEAFALLREGAASEDELVYDEPPGWMLPVRHALGALLMSAGRYAKAEGVYLEDLERNPGNGWALLGLQKALEAQGREREAGALEARLAAAWPRPDVSPTSSCYCEP